MSHRFWVKDYTTTNNSDNKNNINDNEQEQKYQRQRTYCFKNTSHNSMWFLSPLEFTSILGEWLQGLLECHTDSWWMITRQRTAATKINNNNNKNNNYDIILHYITLYYITLHYITLHYITLHKKPARNFNQRVKIPGRQNIAQIDKDKKRLARNAGKKETGGRRSSPAGESIITRLRRRIQLYYVLLKLA